MISRWLAFILCRYSQTVTIASVARQLRAELSERAEYAVKYGVHRPVRAIFLRR